MFSYLSKITQSEGIYSSIDKRINQKCEHVLEIIKNNKNCWLQLQIENNFFPPENLLVWAGKQKAANY